MLGNIQQGLSCVTTTILMYYLNHHMPITFLGLIYESYEISKSLYQTIGFIKSRLTAVVG